MALFKLCFMHLQLRIFELDIRKAVFVRSIQLSEEFALDPMYDR